MSRTGDDDRPVEAELRLPLLAEVARRHDLRPQVQLGELAEHEVEQVGLVEPGDLLVGAVLLQHLERVGGEGTDVGAQLLRQVVGGVQAW